MSRQVETGVEVQDNFSAFEDDGYSKRSGLTAGGGDFSVSVFKNGSLFSLAVTITEIGSTGEYRVKFTPPSDGYYSIQVLINFSKDIWEGEFTAGPADIAGSLDQILFDLLVVKGLLHYNSMLDNQVFEEGKLTSARLRMFDTPSHIPGVEGGSETLGLLAEFQIESEYDTGGLNKKFVLRRVYP
jgi:hypothetical protein